MLITVPSKRDSGVARANSASWVGDGTALTIKLGFNPVNIDMVNITDVVVYQKFGAMNATDSIKRIAAGTHTIDSTSQILFNGDGTVTVAAATNIAGKSFAIFAQ